MPNKYRRRINLFIGFAVVFLIILFSACSSKQGQDEKGHKPIGVKLVILGTVQDGGSPHIGCEKSCCSKLFKVNDPARKVVSLGIVDYSTKKTWLIEATPDIASQLHYLTKVSNFGKATPDGIFITHAHIGHYAGLMFLGKEAFGAKDVPVFAMPRFANFLENHGPWSQLVVQKNISLTKLVADSSTTLSASLSVCPVIVPHRDEFSETVGFIIKGPSKSILFIPDINKWSLWNKSISDEIAKVDYAFIDATFYDGNEIRARKISEIPHPFVIESLKLFKNLPKGEKNKVYFIHFNHTNPLLNQKSKARKYVEQMGFHISEFGDIFSL